MLLAVIGPYGQLASMILFAHAPGLQTHLARTGTHTLMDGQMSLNALSSSLAKADFFPRRKVQYVQSPRKEIYSDGHKNSPGTTGIYLSQVLHLFKMSFIDGSASIFLSLLTVVPLECYSTWPGCKCILSFGKECNI